jgi:hypothetical protein
MSDAWAVCRIRRLAVLCLAPALVGACGDTADPVGDGLITFQLDPQSAVLAPGDSLPVRANVIALLANPRITVRFRAVGPAIARLDTTVASGAFVLVRAAAAGMDSVRATIQVNGEVIDTWLPVTVRPRP